MHVEIALILYRSTERENLSERSLSLSLFKKRFPWVREKIFLHRITLSPKTRCLAVAIAE
jgi:hypothetical protein